VIEFKAIVDDDKAAGDFTFTHFIRRLLAEKGMAGLGNWIFRFVLGGVLIWFGPHFYRELF